MIRVRVVSSPIETVLTVKTVCAPIQVDVKVTNTGDLEFTMEMLIRCWTRIIVPYFGRGECQGGAYQYRHEVSNRVWRDSAYCNTTGRIRDQRASENMLSTASSVLYYDWQDRRPALCPKR